MMGCMTVYREAIGQGLALGSVVLLTVYGYRTGLSAARLMAATFCLSDPRTRLRRPIRRVPGGTGPGRLAVVGSTIRSGRRTLHPAHVRPLQAGGLPAPVLSRGADSHLRRSVRCRGVGPGDRRPLGVPSRGVRLDRSPDGSRLHTNRSRPERLSGLHGRGDPCAVTSRPWRPMERGA